MESGKHDHTIVLVKNYWEGFFQSILWLLVLAVAISYAVWIQSIAMQWIMGIIWFISLLGWAIQGIKKKRFTPDDAIAEIEKIKKSHRNE